MKRELKDEEHRLWARVAQTVHPLGARHAPSVGVPPPPREPPVPPPAATHHWAPKPIEPKRLGRIARGRDLAPARLDLHGMTQDEARAALNRFLARAQADGERAAVVITGRGVQGDGVLRRRAPEWLAEPHLHGVVAGVAEAHRRHGGEGALYVALKRKRPR
ncbi:MAG TPA: Smr/MutS family protein [Caulobacteraceae bacterium]|nr:Smr/MutS family protein [Caulobacteraceae bacterium]